MADRWKIKNDSSSEESELFVEGNFSNNVITRLIEDVELERHVDLFLSSECCVSYEKCVEKNMDLQKLIYDYNN